MFPKTREPDSLPRGDAGPGREPEPGGRTVHQPGPFKVGDQRNQLRHRPGAMVVPGLHGDGKQPHGGLDTRHPAGPFSQLGDGEPAADPAPRVSRFRAQHPEAPAGHEARTVRSRDPAEEQPEPDTRSRGASTLGLPGRFAEEDHVVHPPTAPPLRGAVNPVKHHGGQGRRYL